MIRRVCEDVLAVTVQEKSSRIVVFSFTAVRGIVNTFRLQSGYQLQSVSGHASLQKMGYLLCSNNSDDKVEVCHNMLRA